MNLKVELPFFMECKNCGKREKVVLILEVEEASLLKTIINGLFKRE